MGYCEIDNPEFRLVFDAIPAMFFVKDLNNRVLMVNKVMADAYGMAVDEIEGKLCQEIFDDEVAKKYWKDDEQVINTGKPKIDIIEQIVSEDGTRWMKTSKIPHHDKNGKMIGIIGFSVDITSFKFVEQSLREAERRYRFASDILELLNQGVEKIDLIREILIRFKNYTNADAVAIRLRDGNDYPYYTTNGFSDDFVKAENSLCPRAAGDGCSFVLECMCGNVIQGRTDPKEDFFTKHGSFWSNCTSDLLNNATEEELQSRTRNRCNGDGYESVALVPLRSDGDCVGLFQINHHAPDFFLESDIQFFEKIAVSICLALKRMEVARITESMNSSLETKVEERTKELALERDRLKAIFNAAAEGIAVVSNDMVIQEANATLIEMLGIKNGDKLDETVMVDDLDPLRDIVRRGANGQTSTDFKCHMKRIDGTEMPVLVTTTPFPDYGETTVVLLITDITERVAAEEGILRSQTLAAVGTLAAGVAHEFNNIHGIIKGNIDLVLRGAEVLRSENAVISNSVRTKLDVVKDMIERASDITNNLLMFTREQKNGFDVIGIQDVVRGALKLLESEMRSSGIRIYTGVIDDANVYASKGQLGQVFMNLLINAMHALVGAEQKCVYVDVERDNGDVVVSIRDTGLGISEEEQNRIFTPFFTTKGEHASGGSKQNEVRGTGLGLSVVHTVMERHSGSIVVSSKLGYGTTFLVRLPVYCGPKYETEPMPIGDHDGGRVLVLEDEEKIGNIIREILEAVGYDVFYTDDGAVALDEHKTNPFDVMIIDLLMPKMPGLTFIENVNDLPNIPYKVVLTGNARIGVKLGKHGVDHIIMKPFEIEDILQAVNRTKEKS